MTARTAQIDDAPIAEVFIAHERVARETVPVKNPARTSEVVGSVALGLADDVDRAVAAASEAFPAWSRIGAQARAVHLLAAAEVFKRELDLEGTARLLTREHGKVLAESRLDVLRAEKSLRHYHGLVEHLRDTQILTDGGRQILGRRPMGVTGVIVPWNYPVALGMQMLVPALLAGNTAVVKPALEAPLAFCRVLELLARALPRGVVNIVPGGGLDAGLPLVRHPDIRKISFTGSVATGQQILAEAAGSVKRVTLELGGNDPALVLQSAKIDDAMVSELVRGVYTSSGQICYAVKRIYVHQDHYSEFVDRFCTRVNELIVGDGLRPETSFGPVNNQRQYDKVDAIVHDAEARGANVRTLGTKLDPSTWRDGYFMLPRVATDASAGTDLVDEEQFGPVVPILSVGSDDEAIRAANSTSYGLSASIWTADPEYGFSIAPRLEAGSVFVNVHRIGASPMTVPFGGVKLSGLGRSNGLAALEANTEIQAVLERTDMAPLISGSALVI